MDKLRTLKLAYFNLDLIKTVQPQSACLEDRRYRRPTFTRELPSMMDISMWYVVPPHKKRGVYEQEGNLYRPGCR